MKIAIACDFLIDKGGAERIIMALAKGLGADVITTHYIPENTYEEFSSLNVISNKLATYPIPLLMQQEAAGKFKSIDLSEYDTIISAGDYAKHIALNKTLKGKHINITMTIPRILTDLKSSTEIQLNFPMRMIFKTWCFFAARADKKAMSKIETVIVQSREAKRRIETYYGIKPYPEIIYPPIDVKKFKQGKSHGYYLSVQRIMPAKSIETQIEAFNRMPNKSLIIAGSVLKGKIGYLNKLKSMAKSNITFKTNVTDAELMNLYSHCKCTLQTSIREDFGLIPLESMASGKPCIAVNDGGFKETITKKTGILIDEPYVDSLIKAVSGFREKDFKKSDILKRAGMFSDDLFIRKMRDIVFGEKG